MREKRKKIWIDRFQTSLMLRITCYFVIYQAAVWALVALERSITLGVAALLGPGVSRSCSIFLVATIVFLGFLFIYDSLRAAHRIMGPLYRFRQTIKAITAGEELELVRLRKDDFLQELKDDVNEMLAALEQRGALVLKKPETRPGQHQASPVTDITSEPGFSRETAPVR